MIAILFDVLMLLKKQRTFNKNTMILDNIIEKRHSGLANNFELLGDNSSGDGENM